MKIIYEQLDKSIVVLSPAEQALSIVSIVDIAEKDVPFQLPYWIVEDTAIPEDRTFRNAWRVDSSFGAPHGFGGESDEFDADILQKYLGVLSGSSN